MSNTAGHFIVEHGLRAFPIKPGAKAPPWADNNLNLASADVPTLKRYQQEARRRWPTGALNWGVSVALTGLIVIDSDEKPGKVGAATMARFIWPRTLTVRSPSGGRHLYYRQTNVVRFVTSKCPLFGEGSDVDAPGYVLLPGSVLDSGGEYVVIDDAPIALAPDFLAEYLTRAERSAVEQTPLIELDQDANVTRAIHHLRHEAERSVEGRGGEKTLLLVAGHLKDNGISRGMAHQLIAEHYNTPEHCDPLWNDGDGETCDRLDVKIANAYEYLKHRRPGAHTAEAEFGDDEEFAPTPKQEAEDARIREANVKAQARTAKVRDNLTAFRRKNPEAYARRHRRR